MDQRLCIPQVSVCVYIVTCDYMSGSYMLFCAAGLSSRSFACTLSIRGAGNDNEGQDLGTGDFTEYSKLVIILILLHLMACNSLVAWQGLTLDRTENK